MARNANNILLQKAKKSKSDEFYTLLEDIENELKHYPKCQFAGKVVYCNCDDPRTSNFYKYFAVNFNELGLKKLIASCYIEPKELDFVDSSYINAKGFYYEYTGSDNEKIIPDTCDLISFQGNGDFRNSESIALLQQADMVITNPPFSLFREYISQLVTYGKQFLVIGNINAITYKEIFGLIQEDKVWLGVNLGRGISGFIVPQYYELYGTETRLDEFGNRIISPNNCLWLTNLYTPKHNEFISLTKRYIGNEDMYQRYDNYDGINVNRTQDIPFDYIGYMGVPITFLHKFNPAQFEIVGFRKGSDGKDLSINGRCPYFRILIRNKQISSPI